MSLPLCLSNIHDTSLLAVSFLTVSITENAWIPGIGMALDLEVGVGEDPSEEESRESIVVSPTKVPVVVVETSDKGMEGELAR